MCGIWLNFLHSFSAHPKWYQRRITRQVHELAREYGMGPRASELPRRVPLPESAPPQPAAESAPTQLTLL
jgi:VanZ family protein